LERALKKMKINPDLEGKFKKELLPGEALVWCGRPFQGLRLGPGEIKILSVGLLCFGAAFGWVWIWFHTEPVLAALGGLFAVLAGFYFCFGIVFFEFNLRRNTVYALSAQRVLFLREGKWPVVESLNLRNLSEAEWVEETPDQSSLTFGRLSREMGFNGHRRNVPGGNRLRLEGIENGREVYEALLKLLGGGKRKGQRWERDLGGEAGDWDDDEN
jgi:hypothetical protein